MRQTGEEGAAVRAWMWGQVQVFSSGLHQHSRCLRQGVRARQRKKRAGAKDKLQSKGAHSAFKENKDSRLPSRRSEYAVAEGEREVVVVVVVTKEPERFLRRRSPAACGLSSGGKRCGSDSFRGQLLYTLLPCTNRVRWPCWDDGSQSCTLLNSDALVRALQMHAHVQLGAVRLAWSWRAARASKESRRWTGGERTGPLGACQDETGGRGARARYDGEG